MRENDGATLRSLMKITLWGLVVVLGLFAAYPLSMAPVRALLFRGTLPASALPWVMVCYDPFDKWLSQAPPAAYRLHEAYLNAWLRMLLPRSHVAYPQDDSEVDYGKPG